LLQLEPNLLVYCRLSALSGHGPFPHAGHIDRHQRPVDPVLTHTTPEHKRRGEEGPHGSHWRETIVALDGPQPPGGGTSRRKRSCLPRSSSGSSGDIRRALVTR